MALVGAPDSARRRAMAAQLRVGLPVRVTGDMALLLWGLRTDLPEVVDVVVPRGRRSPVGDGLRGHRLRVWHADEEAIRHGVTVTAVPLTLLLSAAGLPTPRLRALLMDAKQRRLTTTADVEACLARHPQLRGRRDLARITYEIDALRADSVLEDETCRRLTAAGLPPDAGQHPVEVAGGRTVHVDLAYRAARLGIECDGQTHGTRSGVTLDALRHNGYHDSEWTVLRVTWDILDSHWPQFLVQLTGVLARRGQGRRT